MGIVSIPSEAGSGTGKVTFSFDAWQEGHVQPLTKEIKITAEP
ncbi:MAG: hypothetical protein ABSG67_21350 [Thermoguttaceae bacterium]